MWLTDFAFLLLGIAIGVLAQAFADAARYSSDRRRARILSRRIAALNARIDRLLERQ